MICPILKGDICSLAGLEVTTTKNNVSICHENVLYSQNLTSSDVVVLTFWQMPLAIFHMDCYVWCDMPLHSNTSADEAEYRIVHVNANETDACKKGRSEYFVINNFGVRYPKENARCRDIKNA